MSPGPGVCPSCGAPLLPGDDVCPFCGEVLGAPRPGAGSPRPEPAPAPGIEPPAWEQRKRLGFWVSLWVTWRDSVFRPVEFFRRLPPRGGIGPALGFAFLFSALALLLNIYWGLVEGALTGTQEGGALLYAAGGLFMAFLWLAFALPLYVGVLFALAGILHLCFMIVGAGRQGFEATFRGVGYTHGPAAFAIFPFFGPLLGMIWGTVILFVAMREVQRTTNGRATLAFLLPLVAFMTLFIVLAVLVALILAGSDLGTLE